MKLNSLHIRKSWSGNSYEGTIEYVGDNGKVELKLRPEMLVGILTIVGDAIVDSSKTIANSLTLDVIEAAKQTMLPKPEEIITDVEEF